MQVDVLRVQLVGVRVAGFRVLPEKIPDIITTNYTLTILHDFTPNLKAFSHKNAADL
jgi:hypothetical protein